MFDPNEDIKHLQASYGYARILNEDFSNIIRDNKRLRYISNATYETVRCCFCGLTDAAKKLLVFAEKLYNDPGIIQEKEIYAKPRTFLGPWAFDIAMFTWLMYRNIDPTYINIYMEASQRVENQKGFSPDPQYLRIAVPQCYTLGQYEYGCHLFEKYSKKKEIPANFSTNNPGMLAYILCRQKLGLLTDVDLSLPVKRFLDYAIISDELLGRGHYVKAATWLKITYWDNKVNPPSPGEVLLKAYNHMPLSLCPCPGDLKRSEDD